MFTEDKQALVSERNIIKFEDMMDDLDIDYYMICPGRYAVIDVSLRDVCMMENYGVEFDWTD